MHSALVGIDHFVITTANVEDTLAFYRRVFGAEVRDLDEWQSGEVEYPVLHFGTFKANVHPVDTPARPRALNPLPGSVDMAFSWIGGVDSAEKHLRSVGVELVLGPIAQEGSRGWAESVYFRDLDGALLELICYPDAAP